MITTETPQNIKTHTGMVHAPGRYEKILRGNRPRCAASLNAVMRMHYLEPTDDAVTCKRCLNRLNK